MGTFYQLTIGSGSAAVPINAGEVRLIVVGDLASTNNTNNIASLIQPYYDDSNTTMLIVTNDLVYNQGVESDYDNCVLTPYVMRGSTQWMYPGTGHHEWGDSGVAGLTGATIHPPAQGLQVYRDGIQTGLVYGRGVGYYYHDLPAPKWRV